MAATLEFRLFRHSYLFKFRVGFFVFCLFIIVLCCALGGWQIKRYHFKQSLVTTYQQRLTAAPIPFSQLPNEGNIQFQSVVVQGHYLNDQTLLVQNRFYQGQLGYEVLTPLQVNGDNKKLLVDRGWIKKISMHHLPSIPALTGTQNMTGYVKLLDEYQFILGANILDAHSFPLVMQKINIDEISRITHQDFYPFILREKSQAADDLTRDWVITTVIPERHLGYAMQWFLMAAVLLIAYLCACCERRSVLSNAQ